MRISDTEKAVQPSYIYDPDKDEEDLHRDHMVYDPPRCRSEWAPRPYSLMRVTQKRVGTEGRCGCQRDADDQLFENHSHPLHQYITYLKDGGRRRCVLTDTGDDELVYLLQWQPGFQLEEGNWLEDYNYIRPGQSSIRDEAYWNWYETTNPRPYSLDMAIEYWVNRRRQLQRANHPLSYEAFFRANQPADGHPSDKTWDYGQLYRLHNMI